VSEPAIEPAIVTIVGRIRERFDEHVEELVATYRKEIVDYAASSERFIKNEVASTTARNLELVLDNLEHGSSTSAEQLTESGRWTTRRVHQGISLPSVQHACRLFGEHIYEAVLEAASVDVPEEREAVLASAAAIMRHVHQMVGSVTLAYLDELEDLRGDREIVRRDLLEAVLAGRASSPATIRDARIVGVELRAENVLVVARSPVSDDDASDGPERPRTLRRAAKILREHLRFETSTAWVGLREGEVVCLCPVERPTEMQAVKEAADGAAAMLDQFGMSVGISSWHAAAKDVPAAYAEAREAAGIAIRTGVRTRAVAFDDVLVDHVLRSSEHAARIISAAIKPLREYDAKRNAELVNTLRAYIAAGFNVAGAARAMTVHNNTIVYRLGRVHELTGRDPRKPEDIIFLALSLRLDVEDGSS
jgi:sugar diacid utilization regulator